MKWETSGWVMGMIAEMQRGASLTKQRTLHAQHPLVEIAGRVNIRDDQHKMVEVYDIHSHRYVSFDSGRDGLA